MSELESFWRYECEKARDELAAANGTIERVRRERNEHAEWRQRLAIKLHDAERDLAAAKARIAQRDAQIAVYNIGGFADADALAERYLSVVNELAAAKALLREHRDHKDPGDADAFIQ